MTKKAFLKEEINNMLTKGVISRCPPNIPWGFQVVIVKKKDGILSCGYTRESDCVTALGI